MPLGCVRVSLRDFLPAGKQLQLIQNFENYNCPHDNATGVGEMVTYKPSDSAIDNGRGEILKKAVGLVSIFNVRQQQYDLNK